MSKKIFIKTFGCQMNEYDSNRIFDTVNKIGFEKTEILEETNCYLLNTCHIRDKAKEKVLGIAQGPTRCPVSTLTRHLGPEFDLSIEKGHFPAGGQAG